LDLNPELWLEVNKISVADPWNFGVDPDADPYPAIFIIDLQEANKKLIFLKKFFFTLIFEGTYTSFSKKKSTKEVTKQ
jgi:hypothetical protein